MQNVSNIKELFKAIADALIADESLNSFMGSVYGESSDIKISLGVTPNDLPEATESACIYLIPGSRSRTRGDAYRQYSISVVCLINAENASVISENDSQIDEITGLGVLDDFTNLVEKCVFNKIAALGVAITPSTGEADLVELPLCRSELAYIVEIPSLL